MAASSEHRPKKKLLWYKKETENKYRWDVEVAKAVLELYVPKWRVPAKPASVEIELVPASAYPTGYVALTPTAAAKAPRLKDQPILCLLEAGTVHTQTIRYNTVSGPAAEISHVYIPFALTFESAPLLLLTVRWTQTVG